MNWEIKFFVKLFYEVTNLGFFDLKDFKILSKNKIIFDEISCHNHEKALDSCYEKYAL